MYRPQKDHLYIRKAHNIKKAVLDGVKVAKRNFISATWERVHLL